MVDSIYLPEMTEIIEATMVSEHEKLFKLRFRDGRPLGHAPCQFVEVSVLGVGEAPISVSSPPHVTDYFELCVRACGNLSNALHQLGPGDMVGIRGPFGNGVDLDEHVGKDLLFVAGGIGVVPLRSLIAEAVNRSEEFGKITVLYGSKNADELLFENEIEAWAESAECMITVDQESEGWSGHVGVVTTLMTDLDVEPDNTMAFIVGPPIMYRFVLLELFQKSIPHSNILMSLERRMKCGVGKCGHCQINGFYVCREGPVFRYSHAEKLSEAV